jgi:putative transposase
MANSRLSEREAKIAEVLRPLGTGPLSRQLAQRAAQLLGVHWTSVYRLRRRFLAHPVASSLAARNRGPKEGRHRINNAVDNIVEEVLNDWLPRQRFLAHPLKDIVLEVRQRCRKRKLIAPSRFTVSRRWAALKEAHARALADLPKSRVAPGEFRVDMPLEVVQIDHTQADVLVVDGLFRSAAKRPWISVAIDVATRCVVGIYVSFERPDAAAVALLVTRVVFSKDAWLKSLGIDAQWPMHGMPTTLHLDNAAEFRSQALKLGCAEYGIKLMYRPVRRPHFGGHVERVIRTLMERLKGLPGTTGNSTKERRSKTAPKPEQTAALTLREFERWIALEIAQRYHHNAHRGLTGATPANVWDTLAQHSAPRQLPEGREDALRFFVHFLPLQRRTVQNDGLTIFYIRYWHPIFTTWRSLRRQVLVRYHPEDLSRLYVSVNGKTYYEARYADLRRPRISLSEQRAVCKLLRTRGERYVSEDLIFKAIEDQKEIVRQATTDTRRVRRGKPTLKRGRRMGASPDDQPSRTLLSDPAEESTTDVDYTEVAVPYPVEIW